MKEYRIKVPCTIRTSMTCAGEVTALTDRDFRRDGRNRMVIPGTSIAGVLRSAVRNAAADECLFDDATGLSAANAPCPCSTCQLFGNVHPVDVDELEEKFRLASRVSVSDATIVGAAAAPGSRVVDGVAIDRKQRAAAFGKKYDRLEVMPENSFTLEVRADDLDPETDQFGSLMSAIRLLGEGRLPIGGSGANGCGRVEADWDELSVRWRDLNDWDHLLAGVMHDEENDAAWPGGWTRDELAEWRRRPLPQNAETVSIQFHLSPAEHSSLMIADAEQAVRTGFDRVPRGGVRQPELPATSLRGALRSTAERILRTIAADPVAAACDVTAGSKCVAPTEVTATNGKHCCVACELFGNTHWASRLAITIERKTDAKTTVHDHVAIDRFTGGAANHRKFNALAAKNCRYQVTVEVDKPYDSADWMVGLLLLALGEFNEGRATVGSGASRGHGLVHIYPVSVQPNSLDWQDCVNKLRLKLGLETLQPEATGGTS